MEEAFESITLRPGYQLEIMMEDSPYLSGAFKPGETVDVGYSIDEGGSPAIALYRLTFYVSWSDQAQTILTSETTGTLQMHIPVTAADGVGWIGADLYDGLTDAWLSSAQSSIVVSASADSLDAEVEQLKSNISALSSQLDAVIEQNAWLESQLNSTGSTLSSIWQELNASEASIVTLQSEIDLLKSELSATRAALNTTSDDIWLVIDMLDAMEEQLDSALGDLNATLEELTAMEEELNSMQDDIDNVDSEISERPTSGTIAMWLVLAMVVSAVVAVVVTIVLGKRRP